MASSDFEKWETTDDSREAMRSLVLDARNTIGNVSSKDPAVCRVFTQGLNISSIGESPVPQKKEVTKSVCSSVESSRPSAFVSCLFLTESMMSSACQSLRSKSAIVKSWLALNSPNVDAGGI